MIDFIQNESKKIIFNCLERESKKRQISLKKLILCFSLNEEGVVQYDLLLNKENNGKNFIEKLANYTINEVLGVRIDFKGYGLIAPPFIQKALLRFSREKQIQYDKLNVFCFGIYDKNAKPDVALFLYEGFNYKDSIQLTDLFNENDAITT